MALQYPGISYLKGYDGKVSDIFDQWNSGVEMGRNDKDEASAGGLLAKLFGAQNGGGQMAAGGLTTGGGGLYPDSLVNGSVDAAMSAEDPMLASYFANTRRAESGGNDSAKNPKSSATGRYQFLEGTWNDLAQRYPDLGLTPDGRNDPNQQEAAMKAFTMDNARQLKGAGVGVNPGTLYAAHFLGAGGASKVLSADPNTPVASLVGPEVIQANPQIANMTVADFQQWAASKGGNGSGGYAGPPMADNPAPSGAPSSSIDPELMAQLFSNRTTRPFVIEMMKARAKTDGGGGELGLSPQFGVDAEGNPVLIQLGKDGRGVQTELPPGVTLSKEPIRLDAGTHFVLLDPITRQPVGQIPKETFQEGYDRAAGTAAGKFEGEKPERQAKATSALQTLETKQSTVSGAIDKALDNANFWTTGIVGQMASAVPGSPAYDLARTLDTIKANIGFNELQTMRDNSPTGGALGSITERELAFLQSTVASIEQPQSEAQLRENLKVLSDYLKSNAQQRRAAFDSQFGTAQPAGGDDVDTILQGLGL